MVLDEPEMWMNPSYVDIEFDLPNPRSKGVGGKG